MLILSRKQNQRILFPNLEITIEILRVSGSAVKVGVEAPSNVRVLREEVVDTAELEGITEAARTQRHTLRNRMNTANLALHLAQKHLNQEQYVDAEKSLRRALSELTTLDSLVASSASATTGKPAANPPESGQTVSETEKKPQALIAEDNSNERELLAAYLRLSGYEVAGVSDGVEALEYLARNPLPDVFLLDMDMPRMSGQETIAAVRSKPEYKDLKIFVVSGSERKELTDDSSRRVDHWFSKPIAPPAFVRELNRELEVESA
ncbi:MAG: response regulator [Pirellulaceae bacterium]